MLRRRRTRARGADKRRQRRGVKLPLLDGTRHAALYAVVDGMRWDARADLSTVPRPTPMPESESAVELRRRLAALPPLRIGMGLTREDPAALARLHARLPAQPPRRRSR